MYQLRKNTVHGMTNLRRLRDQLLELRRSLDRLPVDGWLCHLSLLSLRDDDRAGSYPG